MTNASMHVSTKYNTHRHVNIHTQSDNARTHSHLSLIPVQWRTVWKRTNVHAVSSAWSNERVACKRRVPETGRMYSPLPHLGSWSSRWAGRRCCGKERWAWWRCYCCVARHRHRHHHHSSSLVWSTQSGGDYSL